ncbi:UNC-like C-terminal-domain-containing protein [Fomitopsis serialis]|uniref:UNC-like C-terminal-domain-containing protein n=1 Tax=Fomitopsis serialis TaxID=139415 RepID=UPI00200803C2|nr:UNC-like C-terminal-domain-containing protein [Neoantrodia serialis]KAH9923328.1 UNC-like C-terminal-domain-containing protein [Neoantrodia serialis]
MGNDPPAAKVEADTLQIPGFRDDLDCADFASYAAGGRPIETLTSTTHQVTESMINSFTRRILRLREAVPPPPSSALDGSMQPGSCWPMAGPAGHIGIQLADSVLVTDVTIDLPYSEAHDADVAPRFVQVWAVVPTEDDATGASPGEDPAPLPDIAPTDYRLRRQTFPVRRDIPMKVDKVVFQVLDNWGSSEYTCLYGLRVHGGRG